MQDKLKILIAVAISTLLIACGGDDGTGTDPSDNPDSEPASSTRVERTSLEAAIPENGDVVSGQFVLAALLDSGDPREVRFLVDGVAVGIVNESPFEVELDACDLSVGNHAYLVQVEGADGERAHVEQFFETTCD